MLKSSSIMGGVRAQSVARVGTHCVQVWGSIWEQCQGPAYDKHQGSLCGQGQDLVCHQNWGSSL